MHGSLHTVLHELSNRCTDATYHGPSYRFGGTDYSCSQYRITIDTCSITRLACSLGRACD